MKSYYYILAEVNGEGWVLSKLFTDRRTATNKLTEVSAYFYYSEKSEEETLKEIEFIESYDFPFPNTVINMSGMIFCEGEKVNTYLIKSDTEITDFFNLPRECKTEFDQAESACDFPF